MPKVIRNIPQPNDLGFTTWRDLLNRGPVSVDNGPVLRFGGAAFSEAHETPFLVVRESWLKPHEGDYEKQLVFAKGGDVSCRYALIVRGLSASESEVDAAYPNASAQSQEYVRLREAIDGELAAVAAEYNPGVVEGGMTFKAHVKNRYAARDETTGQEQADLAHYAGARIIAEEVVTDGEGGVGTQEREWHGIPVDDCRYDKDTNTITQVGPVWPGDLQPGDVVSLVVRYRPYKMGKKQGLAGDLVSVRRWMTWEERSSAPMDVSLPF